jgi:hypothetical protein
MIGLGLISFTELLSTKTIQDWKQSIVNTATLVALKTSNWVEGGYTRTLVALFAQLYKTAGDVIKLIAASGFLDFATGAWLTLLAKQVFNVDRIVATYAAAPEAITLTNHGGGLYIFEVGDLVLANGSTNKTFRNTSAGTLSPGNGQTLKLDLIAEASGSDSNSIAGSITSMVTTFTGVTCSNDVALFGLDEEKDPDLRQRCRDSLALLAIGGIKKAYEFVAKSAKRSDGSAIGVTRVRVVPPPGDNTLSVLVAGASGAVASDDVAAIQSEFDTKVTPIGFDVTASSAVNLSVTSPCTIWLPSSLAISESSARQSVFDALRVYVQALPIAGVIIPPGAGKIYWRTTLGVVENAIPGMIKAQLTSEADTSVAGTEVPIWGGLLTDTTVIQVPD